MNMKKLEMRTTMIPIFLFAFFAAVSSPGIGTNPDYFYTKAKSFFEKKSPWPKFMYMVYGEHDYPQSVTHTSDFYNFLKSNAPADFKCHMEMIKNDL